MVVAGSGGPAGGNPGGHVAAGAEAVKRPGEVVGQDAEHTCPPAAGPEASSGVVWLFNAMLVSYVKIFPHMSVLAQVVPITEKRRS